MTADLSEARLAAIRERERKATPGEWYYIGDNIVGVSADCCCPPAHDPAPGSFIMEPNVPHEAHDIVPSREDALASNEAMHAHGVTPDFEQWKDDCRFIAAARTDVLLLLEAIAERDGIIADMMQDGGFRLGQEVERGTVLADIRQARAADERSWDDPHSSSPGAIVCDLIEYGVEARGSAREPLPPAVVRAEYARLRAGVLELAAMFAGLDGHARSDETWDELAKVRDCVQEKRGRRLR